MVNEALERVIEALGGPTEASYVLTHAAKAARLEGVSYWTIRKWRVEGRVRDSRLAVLVEREARKVGIDDVSVADLAGLDLVSGNGGDAPRSRRRFLKGGKMSATYQVSSPDLPVVPRFPDAAARAA